MHNTQSRLPVNDNDVVASIATIGTFEAVVFFLLFFFTFIFFIIFFYWGGLGLSRGVSMQMYTMMCV